MTFSSWCWLRNLRWSSRHYLPSIGPRSGGVRAIHLQCSPSIPEGTLPSRLPSGVLRCPLKPMKNEHTNQKLKPERVQAGLTFTVNGKAVDSEHVTFVVDGTELSPEHVSVGILISKLKPERVQAGLTLLAEGFRYAMRGRFRKAVQTFNEAVEIFVEITTEIASSFSIEIAATENVPEVSEA